MKFVQRLAKFTNYDTFAESAFGNAMQPNAAFSEPKTITVGSKMNDDQGGGTECRSDTPTFVATVHPRTGASWLPDVSCCLMQHLRRFGLVVVGCLAFQVLWAARILVPMDNSQTNHLKAYGVAFWVLENGVEVEWLLNYRGGSFCFPTFQKSKTNASSVGCPTRSLPTFKRTNPSGNCRPRGQHGAGETRGGPQNCGVQP